MIFPENDGGTAEHVSLLSESPGAALRGIPEAPEERRRVREVAARLVENCGRQPAQPSLVALEKIARAVLDACGLPLDYLAFAVVWVHNAWWMPRFRAVPFDKRLLLMPHCLRRRQVCRGNYEGAEFFCAQCGACVLGDLLAAGRELGYRTLVAEGTPPVFRALRQGGCEAVLGVACLHSLEESFRFIRALGVPGVAAPLLRDGCVDTVVEPDLVRELLGEYRLPAVPREPRRRESLLPLWRTVDSLFDAPRFHDLLRSGGIRLPAAEHPDPAAELALDWLRESGKRLRPVMVLGVYQALTDRKLPEPASFPEACREHAAVSAASRLALAMEALHKASLVHDDIADDDMYRYGRLTLHRRYGIPVALNVGDYLIGIGYRLAASSAEALGADSANALLAGLAETHLTLCRGQGQELDAARPGAPELTPLDILAIYARKTSAAFSVSLEAGAIAAGKPGEYSESFTAYARALGVAYQIRNDLEDWDPGHDNKRIVGQDAAAGRPTVLRAFALEQYTPEQEKAALDLLRADPDAGREALRGLYERSGAFEKSRALYRKFRDRGEQAAKAIPHAGLRRFLISLVRFLG